MAAWFMFPPDRDDDVSLTREELDACREAAQKLEKPVPPPIHSFEELYELAHNPPPRTAEDDALLARIDASMPLTEEMKAEIFRAIWLNEPLSAEQAQALWAAYNHARRR